MLSLSGAKAVGAAFDTVLANARAKAPTARIDGVLVQEMIRGGAEMIVGMKRDPVLGPAVLAGLGGIFVEVLEAYSLACAPFGLDEARRLLNELPGRKILDGMRGAAPRDTEALAVFLARFSQFAAGAAPMIEAIDLNPVLVLERGCGVVIADALFVIDQASSGLPGVRGGTSRAVE